VRLMNKAVALIIVVFIFLGFIPDSFAITKDQQEYFNDLSARKAKRRDDYNFALERERGGHLRKACVYYLRALSGCSDAVLADTIRMRLIGIYLSGSDARKALFHIERLESPQLKILSRGKYYLAIKDYLHAFNNFNNYLSNFSSDDCSDVYLNTARALFAMGRINDAHAAYIQAASDAKSNNQGGLMLEALYGAGICLLRNSDIVRAKDIFVYIVDKDGGDLLVKDSLLQLSYIYLGITAKLMNDGEYRMAVSYFSYLDAKGFMFGPWYFDYALALEKSSDIKKACQVYQKIADRGENDELFVSSALRLGKLYEKINDIDRARKAYSLLLSLNRPEAKIAREKIEELKFK
jgi:tetratricopeptide (TPR) repeat protein